ncbi:MAG: precorrin-8X methylmutase [Eubacteriales bacterium]|nr:precorrin-8X methylmutase [Eubacteriales bacterium]
MIRRAQGDGSRHSAGMPYMTQELASILADIEHETNDATLAQSIYFSPTALTHVKRLIEMGGTIITDTTLVANGIDINLMGNKGAKIACFIDEPQVISLAEQRRITRAEIAVDYGLALSGPKLMVVGSAPAAINRMIRRRQHEPMSDVCVLAASTGFASVVQLKERLMDSDLTSIVVRGKKGGIPATIAIVNAILREIAKPANKAK